MRELEEKTRAEKIEKQLYAPSARKKTVITTSVAPVQFAEKFAFLVLLVACVNASLQHFFHIDYVQRTIGEQGSHVFWALTLVSALYVLGIFRDLLKEVWQIEQKITDSK